MLLRSEHIHKAAAAVVEYCGTRNVERIAKTIGIFSHYKDDLGSLLGMYVVINRERHILLNTHMEPVITRMVFAHEIGHDQLHRDLAKRQRGLQEFVLFDMRNDAEYEANAFAAHLLIDDDELWEMIDQGYDVVQLASCMGTNVNLMLIKLHEMNRIGYHFNLPYIPHHDFLKDIVPES